MSRGPGGGEGQEPGRHSRSRSSKRTRAPRPSPSQLPPAEAAEKAFAVATRLLAHRERSRAELRTRLISKGYSREAIDAALERLEASGLQSDERFAQSFTVGAQKGRGLSSFALQGELRRRGIDKALAAEAATEHPDAEEARARDLALRRSARLGALAPEVRFRRILGFLARRGYPPELCRRLAAEAAQTVEEDDESRGAVDGPDNRVP